MLKRIIRIITSLLGVVLGVLIGIFINKLGISNLSIVWQKQVVIAVSGAVFGIIFYFLTPIIISIIAKIANSLEKEILKYSAGEIIYGAIGLIFGFIIAYLISQPFLSIQIAYIGVIISSLLYILLGYLGIRIATMKKEDVLFGALNFKKNGFKFKNSKSSKSGIYPKILDTSVIIDGRITDICKTGFLEGPLVIPEFVLKELRHIADSSDSLKRNRGRRGLDILNHLQKEGIIEVIIETRDFEDEVEVDIKLLKLAEELGGKVLTNDFNLNKVAEFQGVKVLNINELANSVKPIVLPGEEMNITIAKDGKESNQGLAYLDDGTMIVVEGGKKFIGVNVIVTVTSVLQTAAGRMIFAKIKTILKGKVS
ncbi:TRAM domain-containing protein [Sedimentibacter sp. zth1]|uniref:PIN/TRAM domain-containing protein n=1 Tax=Sedimentibacter sp. zth1 TaxID=2816908 RepID=UPI001A929B63|nr:PIN domain-containing protein [Sedimentibacter sp. zth1]QSX07050.1 TRAM domain-containing protein [Sedimentibacter sp. zth1]